MSELAISETLKAEITAAMKAGDKQRVSALRLILSELQKDAKEGNGDELAVLRRERKRRFEAAEAYREAERPELAEAEESEAAIIEEYLPAELDDDKLREIVGAAIAESGAESAKDTGQVMKLAMAKVAGQADGKRVAAIAQELLRG
jgi:uncharacterized protein YqeY